MRWNVGKQLLVILGLIVIAVILWIDIATGLWQDYVILSGLAAGLVTFLLSALVIDRVVAMANHKRWAPVTRLALTDILHALADDERSEVAHGKIVPQLMTMGDGDLVALRHDVVAERDTLTRALAQWSNFLASSADATDILDNVADCAERLDIIRDVSLEVESTTDPAAVAALQTEIQRYNDGVRALITEIEQQIAETNRIERARIPVGGVGVRR